MITRTIHVETKEQAEEYVVKNRLFNVYVVSLPRDGSTLVSKILQSLGVNMIHNSDRDEAVKRREHIEAKRYGEVWRMQPNNEFMEIVANRWESYLDLFKQPYSGCKMIVPVNGLRLALMAYTASRVVLLRRDPEEVRQSQEASYSICAERPDLEREKIRTLIVEQEQTLIRNNITYIVIDYRQLIQSPGKQVQRIAEFINAPNPVQPAMDLVEPERYRFKKEYLVYNA